MQVCSLQWLKLVPACHFHSLKWHQFMHTPMKLHLLNGVVQLQGLCKGCGVSAELGACLHLRKELPASQSETL